MAKTGVGGEIARGQAGEFCDLLTTREIAHFLGNSVRTLERWRQKGEGPPSINIGGKIAYRREDVQCWMRQETRGRKEPAPMEEVKEVTACPYIRDPSRWHADITYTDPRTDKPVRVRRVAPKGLTLEGAIRWGEAERLRIVTDLARGPGQAKEERNEPKPEPTKPPKSVPTLADVWPDFEAAHVQKQKRATRKIYRSAWAYIGPVLGSTPLDRIDLVAWNNLRDALVSALETSSAKMYATKATRCVRWAMGKGICPLAEVPELEWPKEPERHVEIYSSSELEDLIDRAPDLWERVLFLLLADGCLRIGEVAGLMWRDVNYARGKHGTMMIVRNVSDGVLQDSPKGEAGEVPLTPRLADALRKLQAHGEHPAWVLPRSHRTRGRSKSMTEHSKDRSLAKLVSQRQEQARLPVHGPHRIRHSRLTHLAEKGLPLRALQHLARHKHESTTERYYLHVNKLKLAALAVDEIAILTADPTDLPVGNGLEANGTRAEFLALH